MKERLESLIATGMNELFGLGDAAFSVDRPVELDHGDYATNVALLSAKKLNRNPLEVAEALVKYVNEQKEDSIQSVSIAGPGFINFNLKPEIFAEEIEKILTEKENYGRTNIFKDKTILVEHSSPNLFKPFHIGHLMNNTIGESIARLAKFSGATVTTISFPSDISLGVAKAIFILLEKYGANFVPESVTVLGDAYVEGVRRYDEDESVHSRIKEIANNLYSERESPELTLFLQAKQLNMSYFEQIVSRLGSDFDAYIFESEAGGDGKRIVLENTPMVFKESEGAVVYIPDESRKDINTAVFINSQGNPTYEAKDLGLLDLKFSRYSPDLSIFITDAQQVAHFKVVLDAAQKINPTWSEKSLHRYHGRMSFKGQKMSSRLGGVPLVEDVVSVVVSEIEEKNADISAKAAESIAISAIKFAILRTAAGKDINFDPDTSLSFEGSSGPYLQYSAVRAKSVLSKRGEIEIYAQLPDSWQTSVLEKTLIHFPQVLKRSIEEWAPHHVVSYLLELSQAFNSWYGNTKIIQENDPTSGYKLAISEAFVQTMKNGLHLLGISVPEKM